MLDLFYFVKFKCKENLFFPEETMIMELKCPSTVDEQLKKLQEHGLSIEHIEEARCFLNSVSYYRLTGYSLQFRKDPSLSDFAEGHCFSELLQLYDFDFHLRSLLRHYIEIIEVYYKTQISNTFALEKCMKPPHDQHYDENNYYNKEGFNNIIDSLQREKQYYCDNLVVKHHNLKYEGKMPLWVIVEFMSFSHLSMLYSAMYNSSQDNIANKLHTGRKMLANHLHCISVLRNKCAHAARLINTKYSPPAKLSAVFLKNNPDIRNDSLFAYLKVLAYRLPSDKLRDEFKTEIIDLVERYKSFLDIALIDFPCDYEKKL